MSFVFRSNNKLVKTYLEPVNFKMQALFKFVFNKMLIGLSPTQIANKLKNKIS